MNIFLSAFKVPLPDIALSALIGIALVFFVLLVLIALLYAFRAILSLFGKKKEGEAKSAPQQAASANDQAVVAAIMGAVSAYRNDDGVELKVKSIKKQ